MGIAARALVLAGLTALSGCRAIAGIYDIPYDDDGGVGEGPDGTLRTGDGGSSRSSSARTSGSGDSTGGGRSGSSTQSFSTATAPGGGSDGGGGTSSQASGDAGGSQGSSASAASSGPGGSSAASQMSSLSSSESSSSSGLACGSCVGGCCLDGACQMGDEPTACGHIGGPCLVCPSGGCVDGQCVGSSSMSSSSPSSSSSSQSSSHQSSAPVDPIACGANPIAASGYCCYQAENDSYGVIPLAGSCTTTLGAGAEPVFGADCVGSGSCGGSFNCCVSFSCTQAWGSQCYASACSTYGDLALCNSVDDPSCNGTCTWIANSNERGVEVYVCVPEGFAIACGTIP